MCIIFQPSPRVTQKNLWCNCWQLVYCKLSTHTVKAFVGGKYYTAGKRNPYPCSFTMDCCTGKVALLSSIVVGSVKSKSDTQGGTEKEKRKSRVWCLFFKIFSVCMWPFCFCFVLFIFFSCVYVLFWLLLCFLRQYMRKSLCLEYYGTTSQTSINKLQIQMC